MLCPGLTIPFKGPNLQISHMKKVIAISIKQIGTTVRNMVTEETGFTKS
jgi:hypothetical protein